MANERAVDRLRVTMDRSRVRAEVFGVEMFFEPLTFADLAAANARTPGSDEERNLILLVLKAKDAEGKPVFSWADLPVLRTEVPVQRLRVALEAMYGALVSEKDAETELGKTPASTSD
jgi:hypothetical protein